MQFALCQAVHLPPLDVGYPQLVSSAACKVLAKSLGTYKMIFQPPKGSTRAFHLISMWKNLRDGSLARSSACLGFKARQELVYKPASKGENRTQDLICCAKAVLSSLSCSFLFGALRSSVAFFNSFWSSSIFFWIEEKNGLEILSLGHVMDALL